MQDTNEQNTHNAGNSTPHIERVETDYNKHEADPAPSEEAVVERNEDGAGKTMKWIIPLWIVIGLVAFAVWWFFFRNNPA